MRIHPLPLLLLLACNNSKPVEPAKATEPAKTVEPAATEPASAQAAKPADAGAAEPEMKLAVGTPAPDFSLRGSDGKTHTLAEIRGKQAVVLAWFPKAFTGGCTAECKSLKEGGDEIRKYDAAYFAVSTDTPEDNKKFAEQLSADFPILADPTGETAKAFGVLGADGKHARRWTFYIDKDGTVRDVDREVKPATAAPDVAQHLEKLGVAKRSPT